MESVTQPVKTRLKGKGGAGRTAGGKRGGNATGTASGTVSGTASESPAAILSELEALGSPAYRGILARHGVSGPCYGVKIEHLQKIRKRVGKDHALALALYASGVYDAQYLAGLIADDARMGPAELRRWVEVANAPLAAVTVAWVAAGSPDGWELALEWIDAERELVAVAGWSTLCSLLSIRPDADLDLAALQRLLARVEARIHQAPGRLRLAMNNFVIALGCHVLPLSPVALAAAARIGPVRADRGDTACQVPDAQACIRKLEQRGTIGKKRKSAKC